MMIRKLLTTTALASVIATAAFAQTATTTEAPAAATTTAPADSSMAPAATTTAPAEDAMATTTADSGDYVRTLAAGEYLASNLTGQKLYQSDAADAESAGEIDNFLVNNDGKVVAAIVDTAGLDESKVVAVPIDKISWAVTEAGDEPRGVLTATRDELVAAPAFTRDTAIDAAQTTPAAGTNMAATPATGDAMSTDTAAATAPAETPDAKPMQSADMGNGAYPATVGNDQFLSQKLIGESVYSGPGTDAESIGSVNDLVLADSGQVKAAVIGVGGFLGIGEKNVGVPFANLQMTKNDSGEPRAVLAATKDQLKAAPDFNEDPADVATADSGGMSTTPATGDMAANNSMATTAPESNMAATAPTDTATAPAAPANDMAATTTAPASDVTASTGGDRAGMTPVQGPELTAEKLIGTTVYGPNDGNIGEVGDIALNAEGNVDAIIVDVGGFLGIGEKPVAVAMDNLQFMKDSGGSMYLYTQFTQEELENVPEYNSSTYAENRDQMRIGADGKLPAATDKMAPASDSNAMAPKADGTAQPAQ